MIESILERYDLIEEFNNKDEMIEWYNSLNITQKRNLSSLNIDPDKIDFDTNILINEDLLNKSDYKKRIDAIMSIDNAEGCQHLFDRLVTKEFLDSPKFYEDIETLKRAEYAQTPLWIIGKREFIDSPYHDEDFETLVTARDSSGNCDSIVWENIATLAKCEASIRSEHHRDDMEMIVKCGSKALQTPHCIPESSIGYLACNEVSLKDPYHRENMEILAENYQDGIGGYLYRVMINNNAIHHRDYRTVINDMVENKNNEDLVYLLCAYLVGCEEAGRGINPCVSNPVRDLMNKHIDIGDTIKMIEEKYSVVDGEYRVIEDIEDKEMPKTRKKGFVNRIFKK